MALAISALLSAAIALAGALLPATAASSPVPESPAPFVEPPDLEQRVRQITDDPPDPALERYTRLLLVLTIGVAALIFISGLDDALVDACYWLSGARRRSRVTSRLEEKPESAFAIMVPAWKESDVIAAMIENTVKTLDYKAFRIFCGVYRNDPATAREVDRMVERYGALVTRVDVPHDGPTCKGDCLNHIVRRVLADEHSSGSSFAGMVLHDSEDVIHPLELKLFNTLVPGIDLVQLPVFSLDRSWRELTAGTYVDDFAEAHGKDMAAREALVGIVPGAGVATCYSAAAMAALWQSSAGEPFNTASLTEDYDLSFRLRKLGMSQTFAHVAVDFPGIRAARVCGRTGSVIATHEYFPDKFKAAYRQRARWVLGIAFQGWRHMGWRGSALERYFLFRDRKSIVMAPAGAAAYVLLAVFVSGIAFGSEQLRNTLQSILSIPVLPYVLLLNLVFMINRALQRMYFVGRYYGPMQGLLAVLRMPVNNLVNFFAVMRAWRLFLVHVLTGKKLAWDKTAHVYPDAVVLAPASATAAKALVAIFCAFSFFIAEHAVAAAPPLTPGAYELADEAYKALERGELERAMDLASRALNLAPGHASLLLLQADILARQEKHAEALGLIRALPAGDLGATGLAQRGYLWLEAGNPAAAEADFVQAVETGALSAEARANVSSELAYLALRRNDETAALHWFDMAIASGRSSPGFYADAGYAAIRLARNREAVEMLSKAVDEWHAAPSGTKPFDDTQLYGMRRSIDSLSRRWGATLSLGHSSTPGTAAPGLAASGDLRVMQAGAEVFYTPESFGYRNERIFQWYANMFQGVSASDGNFATGADSRVAALGARYKPLQNYNLVFAVERRLALGDRAGEDDWLLRVGWSASSETDWHPTRDSWTTWQVYTETAYFIEAERLIQPFDARIGRSWKLPRWHGAVVTPFIGIAGEYDEAQTPRTAAGIGPGIALRYWFGESRHRAFPSHIDFSLQYRYRLTDAKRGGGLFGLLALSF